MQIESWNGVVPLVQETLRIQNIAHFVTHFSLGIVILIATFHSACEIQAVVLL